MGNQSSNLNRDEKDLYLREIKRLTQYNQQLQQPTINMNTNSPLMLSDQKKIEMQNKLQISEMQKQIAMNHAEIDRLKTQDYDKYNSSYSKIVQQQTTQQTNNNSVLQSIIQNPHLLNQILHSNNITLSPQDRQQLSSYLTNTNNANNRNVPGNNNNSRNQLLSVGHHNNSNNKQIMHQNMGTQDLMRKPGTGQLNIEDLTKSYYNDEESERLKFEIEQQKRKQEFEERQKKRRTEFNLKLQDFELGPINAQKLFELPDGFTLEMLNKSYKKLALKTHPDRVGGNAEQFRNVTKAYMLLMERLKQKEQDKSFYDLKKGASSYYKQQDENVKQMGRMDKDRFNLKLFNQIYEENRLYDPNDDGYDKWFRSEKNTYEQPKIFSDKFNVNIFNTVFDQMKEKQSGMDNGQLVTHNEPNALMSKSDNMDYTTLGQGSIDNFGKTPNNPRNLMYSDLKEAYTKTHLINPNMGGFRKDYNSIEDLKKDRENINHIPDEKELLRQEMERVRQREEEDRRLSRLRVFDDLAGQHYNTVHQRMLGENPDINKQLTYNN